MCECEIGKTIHYGVAANGSIDTTKQQAFVVANQNSTKCSNDVFGDPV